MDSLCDEFITTRANTCIPHHSDKIFKIKQMLDLPLKVYNHQNKELTESANTQVQLQYTELMNVLKKLALSRSPRTSINIDEILKRMQFQECVGAYSTYNLVQAVKKVNRASEQSKCRVM